MIKIGDYNTLPVARFVDFGAYLGNIETIGEVLLPKRYFPKDLKLGDEIEIFVYTDSEDRIIATTEKPLARIGECAFLEVKAATPSPYYRPPATHDVRGRKDRQRDA